MRTDCRRIPYLVVMDRIGLVHPSPDLRSVHSRPRYILTMDTILDFFGTRQERLDRGRTAYCTLTPVRWCHSLPGMATQPHWQPVSDELGIHVGRYPFGSITVNMIAIEIDDGKLMVISPGTGVSAETYAELDTLGTVVALVSPGAFHNMGLPEWSTRYPDARIFATESGLARIPKVHKELRKVEPLTELEALVGDDIHMSECPAKRHGDLVLFVCRKDEVAMFTNEVLGNQPELPKSFVVRTLFKLTKSGPGLRMNGLAMKLIGAKKRSVASYLLETIDAHGVSAFVPCHGDVLVGDNVRERLTEVLRDAA